MSEKRPKLTCAFVRGNWAGLCLLVTVALLGAGEAAACAMHGFSFNNYLNTKAADTGPALPEGTRLEVSRFVTVDEGTASNLSVTFSVPTAFEDPSLTIDGPVAVSLEDEREQPLAHGEGSLTLPFTAPAGYYRLTLSLRGSVEGEVVSLSRQAYVVVRTPDEVATR